ncbi:MAG: ShlB/FhaC/HecB family hemolysin secretion/activation protein [Pseudomonadota bacterium]
MPTFNRGFYFVSLVLAVLLAIGTGPLARAQASGVPDVQPPAGLEPIRQPEQASTYPGSERAASKLGDVALNVDRPRLNVPPGLMKGDTICVKKLIVEGNQVFSDDEIIEKDFDGLVEPGCNTWYPVSAYAEAARNLEERYREAGYLLSQVTIPEQKILRSSGEFRIRIFEGRIARAHIEPGTRNLKRLLDGYLEPITSAGVAHNANLERQLLLMNDIPGMSVRGVLRAGTEVGTSELVVKTQTERYEGYLLANNRGSRYTGEMRAMAIARANRIAGPDRLEAMVLSSLEGSKQRYGHLIYQRYVGYSGLSVEAGVRHGPSEPRANLRELEVEAVNNQAHVLFDYPLRRSKAMNFGLRFGLEVNNNRVDVLDTRFSEDRTRVVTIGTYADFYGDNHRSRLKLMLRHGLPGLGATPDDDPQRSRLSGSSNFTSLQMEAATYFGLNRFWTVDAQLSGQYAFQSLLSTEELLLGGERFGRGYDPAEIAGDHGVGLALEVQRTVSTQRGWLQHLQGYGFYDVGLTWNQDRYAQRRMSLASAGLGVRVRLLDNVDLSVEYARPLTRSVASQGDRDGRFYGQFSLRI